MDLHHSSRPSYSYTSPHPLQLTSVAPRCRPKPWSVFSSHSSSDAYLPYSSNGQLLGREYYQTVLGERYLLFGPLFIHSSSAIIKRCFSPPVSRPFTSALSVTGYAIAFCILPVHFITHRLAPADPAPPISSLGPSPLNYEFAKAALIG